MSYKYPEYFEDECHEFNFDITDYSSGCHSGFYSNNSNVAFHMGSGSFHFLYNEWLYYPFYIFVEKQ